MTPTARPDVGPDSESADATPSQMFELKVLFFKALGQEYEKAGHALAELHQSAENHQALEVLYRFFHGIAGTAEPVGLQLLSTVASTAERIAHHLAMDRYPDRKEAVSLLASSLDSIGLVLSQQGGDQPPAATATPPRLAPRMSTPPLALANDNRELSKILVVDDDQVSAGLIESCLRAAGFSCSLSCHPQQALRAIENELPDLIVLDVVMPGLDGFELCRRVRNHPALQFTPIIFVTQKGDVEERVRGLEAGGNDYVTKPFEPQELIARVHSHLTRLAALREMAVRDGLTRCFNHKYFRMRLEQEVVRARRYDQRLTLAMVDVDRFKQINDTFGHPAGDMALAHLANLIVASVRSSDVVARYGGEEFGILMIQASASEGDIVCGRLRQRVEAYDFSVSSELRRGEISRIPLTVSIGVAELFASGDGSKALLERADAALYEAKRGGRNRVVVSSRKVA